MGAFSNHDARAFLTDDDYAAECMADSHAAFEGSAVHSLRCAAADLFACGWTEAEVMAEALEGLPFAEEIGEPDYLPEGHSSPPPF